MKAICCIVLFLFFFNQFSHAQNLVMNPSFEDTIPCSIYTSIPALPCYPWYMAINSPDYWSSVYDASCGFTVVPNCFFGFQYPRTGNAFTGFSPKTTSQNIREYIAGRLSDTLINNHTYCISVYVSPGNNCKIVTSDIGVYFSVDSILDLNWQVNLPFIPQVVNQQGILNDTSGWTLISGNYLANGGEKYITIGNFKDDANSTFDTLGTGPWWYNGSYYYLDDVSVIDCTTGLEEIQNNSINFTVNPNPAKDKLKVQSIGYQVQRMEIINVLGEVVLKQTNLSQNKNSIEINVAAFSKGIYFLKLISNSGFAVRKFIKE